MFTRCPACQTLFRVRAETLRVAQGQVRCGRCGEQFNALDSLAEDPEALDAMRDAGLPDSGVPLENAAETADARDRLDSLETPASAVTIDGPGLLGEAAETSVGEGVVAQSPALDDIPSTDARSDAQPLEPETLALGDSVPTGLPSDSLSQGQSTGLTSAAMLTPEAIQEALLREEPGPTPWGRRIAMGGMVLLLLAALVAQWVYLQRVPLYEYPQLRPVLQRMCALLTCDLPLPRRPEQIEILERTVREHPRVAKAMLVDLTIVSRAAEPIAYPIIELRLADVSGNRVSGRRFVPAEYLPANLDARSGLQPGKPLQITLELVAPESDAVSFQFDFL